ncbi:unnamed protein product [Gongylonema pulchrum]|uniref:Transposase n=1 Tax=Gongylonema pulchrum TaxID=637853 RepID=A0A183F1F3_9BILA|nr:unnamed protein product [Gongylonema pulchrum]
MFDDSLVGGRPLCDDPQPARIMAPARWGAEECYHNNKFYSPRAGGPHCLSVQCAHCRELRQGALKRCCRKQNAHRAAKCIALLHFALRKYREMREFAQKYVYWTLLANGAEVQRRTTAIRTQMGSVRLGEYNGFKNCVLRDVYI